MSEPDLVALRSFATTADDLAAALEHRSRASTAAIMSVAWSGPRRDLFVLGASELAGRSGAQVEALRALAAEVRALASGAEQRLAALHRLEAIVRAQLGRMLDAARALLRSLDDELRLLTVAVAVVPGMHGVEHRLALARHEVDRLEALGRLLPPRGDIGWEAIARQLGVGLP